MSNFPKPLILDVARGGRLATLREPFAYVDDWLGTVEVPAGFQTDFNSVPRGLWNFFSPWEYPEAAVIHDYLYREPSIHSRKVADRAHRKVMEAAGAPKWKRWPAWAALRLFGWAAWNRIPD